MASKKGCRRPEKAVIGWHEASWNGVGWKAKNAMEKYSQDGFVIIYLGLYCTICLF